MKKKPFTISSGFAQMDLQAQNDLLCDLIRTQEQVIKEQKKQIDQLNYFVQKQSTDINQLKSEISRLKKLKQKPKIRPSKMDKNNNDSDKQRQALRREAWLYW